MKSTKYLIDEEHFTKYQAPAMSVYTRNGIDYVAGSGGNVFCTDSDLTLSDYLALPEALGYRVVTAAEFDHMRTAAFETIKLEIQQINEQAYQHFFDCLPPCRWNRWAGVELFHCSERINGDLVDWFGKAGTVFVRLVDEANADIGHIAKRVTDFCEQLH